MPPVELAALAVPEQAGILQNYLGANPFKLHAEYVGALALVLPVLVLGSPVRATVAAGSFRGSGLFALTIAFGGYTPLYRLYYALLPGTQLFPSPVLAFFLSRFPLVTMARWRWNPRMRVSREGGGRPPGRERPAGAPRWVLGGLAQPVVTAAFLLAARPRRRDGGSRRPAASPSSPATAALLWTLARGGLGPRTVSVLLAVITVADLWVIDRHFFDTVPPPDQIFAPDDVVDYLKAQPGAASGSSPSPPAYRGGATT